MLASNTENTEYLGKQKYVMSECCDYCDLITTTGK